MTSGRGDDEADAANGTEAFGEFFKRHFERAKYGVVDSAEFRASYAEAFPKPPRRWTGTRGFPPRACPPWTSARTTTAPLPPRAVLGAKVAPVRRPRHGRRRSTGGASAADVADFDAPQVDHFLLSLLGYRGGSHPLSIGVVRSLEELYKLGEYKNSEIRCKWLQLRLGAGDETAFEDAADMLRGMGRMKFLRPLYRSVRLCKGAGRSSRRNSSRRREGCTIPSRRRWWPPTWGCE